MPRITEPVSSTAVHFTMCDDSEPVILARIRGSPLYLEYMKDTGGTVANIEWVFPLQYKYKLT